MKQPQQTDCVAICEFLSSYQYLHPHAPIGEAVEQAVAKVECCPEAAEQAIQWLQLDGQASIGRLRRSQVVQLAQSMYRFWRSNLARQNKSAPAA
jgi:hypothetical protein